MKNLSLKASTIMVMMVAYCITANVNAQDSIPSWMLNLPVQKGYVFGAGAGKSSDLSTAGDKARMLALNNLAYNYTNKFENFAISCDSVLGKDNKMREVITHFQLKLQATLKGVETDKKEVVDANELSVVYLLLKMDVSNDVKTLQKEVDGNKELRKKMEKSGLLLKLKGL